MYRYIVEKKKFFNGIQYLTKKGIKFMKRWFARNLNRLAFQAKYNKEHENVRKLRRAI